MDDLERMLRCIKETRSNSDRLVVADHLLKVAKGRGISINKMRMGNNPTVTFGDNSPAYGGSGNCFQVTSTYNNGSRYTKNRGGRALHQKGRKEK